MPCTGRARRGQLGTLLSFRYVHLSSKRRVTGAQLAGRIRRQRRRDPLTCRAELADKFGQGAGPPDARLPRALHCCHSIEHEVTMKAIAAFASLPAENE